MVFVQVCDDTLLVTKQPSEFLVNVLKSACGNCQKKDSPRNNCIYRESSHRASAAEKRLSNPTSPSRTVSQQPECSVNPDTEQPQRSNQRSSKRQPSELTPTQTQLRHCSSRPSSGHQRASSEAFGKVSNFAFTGELKAAVEARLGLCVGGGPGLISVTNAPFFSSGPRNSSTVGGSNDLDYVLPPRRHADDLVGFFWRHIHPLEPLLDESLIQSYYDALFAGTLVAADERLFVSLLNVIFALSTQLRESIDLEERNHTGGTYFQRAWNLIHYPNSVIWDHASLELVQCLLLMTSYLKCTNNPHQTWMVAGSAVLVAQSLGLHRMDQLSDQHISERRRRQQVWLGCLYMDRYVS